MAPWAPRLMLMAGSLGRPRGNPAQVWLLNGTASALAAAPVTAGQSCGSCATAGVPKLPLCFPALSVHPGVMERYAEQPAADPGDQ